MPGMFPHGKPMMGMGSGVLLPGEVIVISDLWGSGLSIEGERSRIETLGMAKES